MLRGCFRLPLVAGFSIVSLLVLMAAVQFALPYVLFTVGLKLVSGAEASLIALIEPVLNPIWVALLLGEQPTAATMAGGAVILLGLLLRYAVLRPREEPCLDAEAEELAEPT